MNGVTSIHRTGFGLHSDDPSFHIERRGAARFELFGEVSSDPTSDVNVEIPGDAFDVVLAKTSGPVHAVNALHKSLPRDVMMTHQHLESGGIEVLFQEMVIPAAKPPRLRIFSTDLLQRVKQLAENKIEFVGASGAAAHLTILCESKRVTLALPAASSPAVTAVRVAASMPQGYRALVSGHTVSVWKDADFFSMVA
jgi:hypothetical protein